MKDYWEATDGSVKSKMVAMVAGGSCIRRCGYCDGTDGRSAWVCDVSELRLLPLGVDDLDRMLGTGCRSLSQVGLVFEEVNLGNLTPEQALYYYRARYYDPNVGHFIIEDKRSMGSLKEFLNLYLYVLGNPVNFNDPLGLWRLKPDVDYPKINISALLDCIERETGVPLLVTSTTEPPPFSPHGPNDVHRRNGGLAVDIHLPFDPEWVLNGAACCGAKSAVNENLHPSHNSTHPHLHIQLVPGPDPGNPGGDLPKNPICKGCKK